MFASLLILQVVATPDAVVEARAKYRERLSRLDDLELVIRTNSYTAPLTASPLDQSAWTNCSTPPDVVHRVLRRGGIIACDTYTEDCAAPEGVRPIRSSFDGRRCVTGPFFAVDSGRVIYETSDTPTRGAFEQGGLCQALEIQFWDSTLPAGYNLSDMLSEPDCRLVRRVGDVSTFAASRAGRDCQWRFEADLGSDGTPARLKITFELENETIISEQFVVGTRRVNGTRVVSESVIVNRLTKQPTQTWGIYHALVESIESTTASPEQLRNPIPSRNVTVRRLELLSDSPGVYTDEYDADGRVRTTKRP